MIGRNKLRGLNKGFINAIKTDIVDNMKDMCI